MDPITDAELAELRELDNMQLDHFRCGFCGVHVAVDEDGACRSCGADVACEPCGCARVPHRQLLGLLARLDAAERERDCCKVASEEGAEIVGELTARIATLEAALREGLDVCEIAMDGRSGSRGLTDSRPRRPRGRA